MLLGGFICTAAFGYFTGAQLGRFLDSGGILPYWDEEDARLAGKRPSPPPEQTGKAPVRKPR